MSLFSFTRQEQIAILFLSGGLLVGTVVTLVKHHHPELAPQLIREERIDSVSSDTVRATELPVPAVPAENLSLGLLKINQATIEELIDLPGIGPKMAERIIAYRTEHGRFQTLHDLKGVKGIGDKTLERLNPLITFD